MKMINLTLHDGVKVSVNSSQVSLVFTVTDTKGVVLTRVMLGSTNVDVTETPEQVLALLS